MRYFVIGADGNKYGPADLPTLQQWLSEARVLPDTWLEEEGSGQRVQAKYVLQQAPPTQPGQPAAPGFFGPPSHSPYPRAQDVRPTSDGTIQIVFGWICAVVSLGCCPPLFGGVAITLAIIAKRLGHRGAQALLVASIIMMVAGIIIGVVSNAALFGYGR